MENIEFELTKENYTGVHSMIVALEDLNKRIQDGM